jgi:hypothetical protein
VKLFFALLLCELCDFFNRRSFSEGGLSFLALSLPKGAVNGFQKVIKILLLPFGLFFIFGFCIFDLKHSLRLHMLIFLRFKLEITNCDIK